MSEGICDSESLETVEYVLHTRDHDTNAYKVLIAAKYADIYVKHVKYSEDPVRKTPDGAISESNAIARYVARWRKQILCTILLNVKKLKNGLIFPHLRFEGADSVLEKRFRFSRPWKPKDSAKQKARIDTLKSGDSLHNWKVLYRNTRKIEFERVSKGFWDMYNPNEYSLWLCSCRKNVESNALIQTLKDLGGLMRRTRLDGKDLFGQMLFITSGEDFIVKGFWLFRGPVRPQLLVDDEHYKEFKWIPYNNHDGQKNVVNQIIES